MRRSLMKVSVVLMGVAIPGALGSAGLAFVASTPGDTSAEWFLAGNLASLPDDGRPRRVMLMASHIDAWTRHPDRHVGTVFLRRLRGSTDIVALRAEHHGDYRIPVDFDADAGLFRSACWRVAFNLDGTEAPAPGCPLLGDRLETLEVRVVADEVWVRFVKPHAPAQTTTRESRP